ncbi:MAG: type II toxin-antitoxin system RelE/ParE family toxin [Synergistaceae bacterium]|nr:type II toxin-antitoxin system RelE/ParE family toxin [Synergistaceae bacterium]
MDFQVKYSEQAAQDISDIIEYICGVLHNPGAAECFYDEVNKKRQNISKNPFMYPLSRDEKLNAEGYRVVVIRNYLLFYFINEADMIVYIARIVYGRRDFISITQNQ